MEPITASEEAELDRKYLSVFQRIAGEVRNLSHSVYLGRQSSD
jgi:hypothetical protein